MYFSDFNSVGHYCSLVFGFLLLVLCAVSLFFVVLFGFLGVCDLFIDMRLLRLGIVCCSAGEFGFVCFGCCLIWVLGVDNVCDLAMVDGCCSGLFADFGGCSVSLVAV